jgi:hypothetical protein
MTSRWSLLIIVIALVGAACSGGSEPAPGASPDVGATAEDPTDGESDAASVDAEDFVEGIVEDLEEQQAASGGGSATLVVGDREWTFAPVLCAFGEAETGQEGAEFVLSGLQDGMQMYASIDSFGHLVSLDDIKNFENPAVSISSVGDGFIEINGKTITAEAEFSDNTSDSFDTIPGTFTATCP